MPAATLQERLTRIIEMAKEAPPEPAYWRILSMDLQDGGFDLGNEADQRALESDLVGVDVIFIDNISTLARLGRENEAESSAPDSGMGIGAASCGPVCRVHAPCRQRRSATRHEPEGRCAGYRDRAPTPSGLSG